MGPIDLCQAEKIFRFSHDYGVDITGECPCCPDPHQADLQMYCRSRKDDKAGFSYLISHGLLPLHPHLIIESFPFS